MATLRTDGLPAQLGGAAPVMVASANATAPVPAARPAAVAQASSENAKDEGVEDVLSILSGRPAPGMPVPPDRPYAVGATLPLSARFTAPQAAAPSAAVSAPVAAPSIVVPSADVPLPPVRPTAIAAEPVKLSFNGGQASAPLAPSFRR